MSEEKIMAMFPGQGSQAIGMASDICENSTSAKQRFEEADDILGYSLSTLCFDGPIEKLTETQNTQPAILTASIVAFEAFMEAHPNSQIVGGLGHSLGEYSALVAAGSIPFADAVQLVHNRGKFMQEAVPVGEGKMAAVLAKEEDDIRSQIESLGLSSVEVANINSPGQIVLAGKAGEIDLFIEQSTGWKIKELQVSAPFHSALMKPAEEQLAPLLTALSISKPSFPVFQNIDGQPSDDPDKIRQNLVQQVSGTVRWVDCIKNLVQNQSPTLAMEFGPGKVLSGLLRRIDKSLPAKPAGQWGDLR